eukprot:1025885-Pyramimonas_sp.AAC.1
MVSKSDWPKFKGKAGANRGLVMYVADLAKRHSSLTVHDQRRLACAEPMERFYSIISNEPRF